MPKEIINLAASVKEKLRNLSAESGKEYHYLVRQYIQERFLYRLSKSEFSENLILKGALLFVAHDISRNRPTRDIDFLGSSISNEKEEITNVIKEILNTDSKDGIRFDGADIDVADIDDDGEIKGSELSSMLILKTQRKEFSLILDLEIRSPAVPLK